jgi:hypothetical protein
MSYDNWKMAEPPDDPVCFYCGEDVGAEHHEDCPDKEGEDET